MCKKKGLVELRKQKKKKKENKKENSMCIMCVCFNFHYNVKISHRVTLGIHLLLNQNK